MINDGSTPINRDNVVDRFFLKDGEKYVFPVYIYTLNDDSGIRYVGQTNDPVTRICHHRIAARNGKDKSKKAEWINSGNLRLMNVIECCRPEESNERERFWINYYHGQGINLLNGVHKLKLQTFA